MKWLIASDLHGSYKYAKELIEIFKYENADKILLLGDILYHGARNDLPLEYDTKKVASLLNEYKDYIYAVKGNCDSSVDQMVLEFPLTSDYMLLEANNHIIFATHGHIFNEDNLPALHKGDILLHGHTHISACNEHETYTYCNPGSITIPKGDTPHGYMILENNKLIWKDVNHNVYKEYEIK